MDICAHMLTRGGQYFEASLRSVLPHVSCAVIGFDGRVDYRADLALVKLRLEFPQVLIKELKMDIDNPRADLVELRNRMLDATDADWVWVVDDDEVYPIHSVEHLQKYFNQESMGGAFRVWAPWDLRRAHRATSKNPVDRLFRNRNLSWRGSFGREKLYSGEIHLWHKTCPGIQVIPSYYVHLTHLKRFPAWRQELRQERNVDGKFLTTMPEEVIAFVRRIVKRYGYKKNLPHLSRQQI